METTIYCIDFDAIDVLTTAAETQNQAVLKTQRTAAAIDRHMRRTKRTAYSEVQRSVNHYDVIVDALMELLAAKQKALQALTNASIIRVRVDSLDINNEVCSRYIGARSVEHAEDIIREQHKSDSQIFCSIEIVNVNRALAFAYAEEAV